MSDFEIYLKNNKVDPCYGLEKFSISKSDIEALLDGKKLYTQVNGGEYAVTIILEDNKK
ncbi:MAG: hypothetical protein K5659_09025 [Lachnospiraceae bacterium]|nr:hypothetical protein [Lachnospiraceae bacterium]